MGSGAQWVDAAKYMCVAPTAPAQEETLLGVCMVILRSAEGADPPLSPGDVSNETPECKSV